MGIELNLALEKNAAIRLPKARKALAGVRFGTRMKVAFIGDSNTAGYRSESVSGSLVANSPPSAFADHLAKHFTVSRDSFWGGGGAGISAAGLSAFDPRITLGTGWTDGVTGGSVGLGGGALVNNTNTTGALSFAPSGAWDKADLYSIALSSGTNTFSADVGSTATNFTPANFVGTKSTYTPGSKAVQTVNVKRVAGTNLNHLAVDCYDSTVGHVAVWNLGHSGSKATDWADEAAVYSKYTLLSALSADLYFLQLALNDYDQATPIATYSAAMQKVITKLLSTGDVVLVVPAPPNAAATPSGPAWSEYVAAIYALAASNNLPLIDLTARFGDYATMNALGLKTDSLHPNRLGYADIGFAHYGLFMTLA